MMFCPKCGSLLVPKQAGGKKVVACSCGYKSQAESITLRETVKSKETKMGIADEEVELLPATESRCPKCGHGIAYFWEIQTRSADEPSTRFYKCQKCKHVHREYK